MDTLLVIPFLAAQPVLDGKLDEAVWTRAVQIQTLHALSPVEGAPVVAPARVRLFHDGEALYIGATLPAPYGIRTENLVRDQAHEGMDNLFSITLGLPPFPAARGYFFAVNAAGNTSDAQITQNTERSFRWDGDWEARVQVVNDTLWTAELRIPLSILEHAREVALQVAHRATLPADQGYFEQSVWFPVPALRAWELAPLPAVRLEGSTVPRLSVTFLPTFTLVVSRPFVPLDYGVIRFRGDSLAQYRLGADLMVQREPLRMAGTILPDFANVEVDEPQILEDPYALLYLPEKRPFFYEGFDFFNTYLRPLYTRRFLNVRGALKGEWGRKHRVQGFWVRDGDLGDVLGLAWGMDAGPWSPRLGLVGADSFLIFSSLRYSQAGRSFRLEVGGTSRGGWGVYGGSGLRFRKNLHRAWAFFWAQHLSRDLEFPTLFRTYRGDVTNGGLHTGINLSWQRKRWQSLAGELNLFFGNLREDTTTVRFLSPSLRFRTTPYEPWFVGAGFRLYSLLETTPTTRNHTVYYAYTGLRTGLFLSDGKNLYVQMEVGEEAGAPTERTEASLEWAFGNLSLGGKLVEWRNRTTGEPTRRIAVGQATFRRDRLYLKLILQHTMDPGNVFPYLEFQSILSFEWGGRSRLYLVLHPYLQTRGEALQTQGAFKIAYAFTL